MNRLPIDWRRVAVIAGVIFLVMVIVDFNARLERLDRLNEQAEIVRAEATRAALTQVALEAKVAYANSDQAVEDYARSEAHMEQVGDSTVVIIGKQGEESIEPPAPTFVPTPKPNWKAWFDLFFGEE